MQAVYGPVASWRLGISLGIDSICEMKVCSFDCIYCQCGRTTRRIAEREAFADPKTLKEELSRYPYISQVANIATFSGSGEPTLNQRLGQLIEVVRDCTELPVAVLTNSSLMDKQEVRKELAQADIVVAKLDAPNERLFQEIDQPHPDINFHFMLDGMKKFRQEFRKTYALQMMFVEQNKRYAEEMRAIAEEIQPNEVQINTPSRANKPKLSPSELGRVSEAFNRMNYISYYDSRKLRVKPFDKRETAQRRPE
ncbi:MAG: radical SAM protein [Candidatus Bathyarchaeota archaeon]|nr:MAG: radical SAM protein [Candidatus Bathyarchaeota archaeon]